jgi:hypothetical protein
MTARMTCAVLAVAAGFSALAVFGGCGTTTANGGGSGLSTGSGSGQTSGGGSGIGTGTSGGSDAGGASGSPFDADAGGALAVACDHYFSAVYGGACQAPSIPADELTRLRPRYLALCEGLFGQTGFADAAGSLEACASALDTWNCTLPEPAACRFSAGTEPTGAACGSLNQCQGFCSFPAFDASSAAPRCGACEPLVPVGQPCPESAPCARNSTCTSVGDAGPTCVAWVLGEVGASCGTLLQQCQPGLYCNASRQCAAPITQPGTSCAGATCAPPLRCTSAGTCQLPGGAGASCITALDCAPSTTCSEGRCVTIGWAMPGQPCSLTATCFLGALNDCPFQGSTLLGTCPTVIADGEPCDPNDATTTCDTFASCLNGTCTLAQVVCD